MSTLLYVGSLARCSCCRGRVEAIINRRLNMRLVVDIYLQSGWQTYQLHLYQFDNLQELYLINISAELRAPCFPELHRIFCAKNAGNVILIMLPPSETVSLLTYVNHHLLILLLLSLI
jgi:hypothetical protein